LGGFFIGISDACKRAVSKKIKKKACEIAAAFSVLQLRCRFGFDRRLNLLPPYHWSLAFSRHRADYSEFALVRVHATRPQLDFVSGFAALGTICRSTRLT
jgi:hypothetical protein